MINSETPPTEPPISRHGMHIAVVERETGLPKDTLRVWERRYGFPIPQRDAMGERVYPVDQVQRLRLIRRLIDLGFRPGRVVALPATDLEAMLQAARRPAGAAGRANDPAAHWQAEFEMLRDHDGARVRAQLGRSLSRMGLARFVIDVVAPLSAAVGDAWSCGRLAIFEEHLFTEAVQSVLRQALGALPEPGTDARPRVLLTTSPGEPHGLGLLMAEALMALEGCRCTSLGVQTPLADIAAAAVARQADIVGLSFSVCASAARVQQDLTELRALLPSGIALWAGGAASGGARRIPPGVRVEDSLAEIAAAVAEWRRTEPTTL